MRRFWLALLYIICCAPLLGAGYLTYRDGVEEYDRGNFAAAFATFQRLAEDGDVQSQNELGQMYFLGENVPQDFAKAAMWFRRAADQGSASAQLSLANMYAHGRGVAESDVDAYMWFSLSGVFADSREQSRLALTQRKQIARRMSVTDRAEGQKRACTWWREHKGMTPDPGLGPCAGE